MEEIKTITNDEAVVKPLTNTNSLPRLNMNWTRKTLGVLVVFIGLGLITGYGLYAWQTKGTKLVAGKNVEVIQTAGEEGVKDASTFKDTATGTLGENDGKLTKEGTHILVRGDVSQNVYLTSSVIDLSKYAGKKVQVWGETFKGQTAGWLMDVGRIKVL